MKSDADFVVKLEESIAAAKLDIARLQGRQLNGAETFLLDQARATLKANEASLKAMRRA